MDQISLFEVSWIPVPDSCYTKGLWYMCGHCGHYDQIYLKVLYKYGYGHKCKYCGGELYYEECSCNV